MWRQRLLDHWPELVVTLAVVGMFADAVFTHAAFFTRDMAAYELPLREWWRTQVLAGEFPQWIPNMGLGLPVIANPVSQALYPFNLMMLLPLPEGLDLYVVAHLVFAGIGAARLARRLGVVATGACVAGLSYALGGYLTSMTTNPFYVCSDSYIPWIVIAMLRVREAPTQGRRMGVLALLVSLQLLAGAFQGAMFSVGLGVVVVLLTHARAGAASHQAPPVRALAAIGAAVFVGALVGAAQILPALRFAAVSTRDSGFDLQAAQAFSTHPLRLLNVVIPGLFGTPFIGPYFAGHMEHMDLPFPFAYSLYSGAACVILIPLALAQQDAMLRRRAWWLATLLVLAWLLALGFHTPVYGLAFRVVPLLDRFRFPEKFFSVASLLAALLSGLGVTAILAIAPRPRRVWPALLCLALPAAIACVSVMFPDAVAQAALDPQLTAEAARRGAAHLGGQATLAVGVAIMALASLMLRQRSLFLAVHVVDLFLATSAYHRTMDLSDAKLAPEIVQRVQRAERRHEPMRLLSARGHFINAEPAVFENVDQALARPNRGVEQGVHFARAYTSAAVQAAENLLYGLQQAPYQRMVRMLAVTSVVGDAGQVASGTFADYATVAKWQNFVLLDVPDPLPRAHVVFRAASVKNDEDAVALITHPNFPADKVAVFVGEIPHEVPQLAPPEMPPAARACKFLRYAREYVSFECDLDRPGIAILADQFIDGWKLEVNSVPTQIQRVDVAYRGVVLPAGKHRLVYRYQTPGLLPGALLSALGVCCLLLLFAAFSWPRRGRTTQGAATPRARTRTPGARR